jgi:hypothetical protein
MPRVPRRLVLHAIPYAPRLARRSVRRFLLCAHSYRSSPPYEALMPGRPSWRGLGDALHLLAAYLRGAAPSLARARCRRTPLAPLPPSRAPTSSRGRATVPVPPLAPAGVDRAARLRAPAGSSPEQGLPRLAAAAAAARHRRHHHRPQPPVEIVHMVPLDHPAPTPARPRPPASPKLRRPHRPPPTRATLRGWKSS